MTSDDSATQLEKKKYIDLNQTVVQLMSEQFQGDKQSFIDHINKVIQPYSTVYLNERKPYIKALNPGNLDTWKSFIDFELKNEEYSRVNALYM